MPKLVEGSDPTDNLSLQLKDKLGFDNNIIIAGGAGDQAAGAIGSGVINQNQSMISLGTSGRSMAGIYMILYLVPYYLAVIFLRSLSRAECISM